MKKLMVLATLTLALTMLAGCGGTDPAVNGGSGGTYYTNPGSFK